MADLERSFLLEARGLWAGYGDAWVVRGIDIEVRRGEVVALLGRNGMGKSTTLKAIMGYLSRWRGEVRVLGVEVRGRRPHELARRGIGYIPQERALFQDLTVEENLRLAIPAGKTRAGTVEEILERWFPRLVQRRRQLAGTLSGGEQKMLLIARALLGRPELLLIDEISEGLQPMMVERVREILELEREERRIGILLVEQNVRFALSLADRYAVMELGRIVDAGSASMEGAEGKVEARLGAF
jgi:ABC-type branched-subunit amino acid transport system ATPase component